MEAAHGVRSPHVVFIHGMFMTPRCWDGWRAWFEARGYDTLAPGWPHHDRAPAEMRAAHPDPALGRMGLTDVVERYANVLRDLPEQPVLIGHSLGGLVVQLLLQRGLGRAGVAVTPAPPLGVFTLRWSFIRCNLPIVHPLAPADEPFFLDQDGFNYVFAHTLPPEAQREAWERLVVPESRKVARDTLTRAAAIDFARPRPPLLILAAELDHTTPASLNASNFARYKPSAGHTDYRVMPGRTHLLLEMPGWEEIAGLAREWIEEVAPRPTG